VSANEGAVALATFIDGNAPPSAMRCRTSTPGEKILHEMRKRSPATFVTPIDREDLSQSLRHDRDILDLTDARLARAPVFGVDRPTAPMTKLRVYWSVPRQPQSRQCRGSARHDCRDHRGMRGSDAGESRVSDRPHACPPPLSAIRRSIQDFSFARRSPRGSLERHRCRERRCRSADQPLGELLCLRVRGRSSRR